MDNPLAEQADEPVRVGLCEFRHLLRVQPNLSPGYPCRYAAKTSAVIGVVDALGFIRYGFMNVTRR